MIKSPWDFQTALAETRHEGERLSLPKLRILVSTQKQTIAHRQFDNGRRLRRDDGRHPK
jgi:hypothetical protein